MDIQQNGEEKSYRACPHCTIQIPAAESSCPHCELSVKPLPSTREPRREERFHTVRDRGREKRKRFLIFCALVLALLLLSYGGSGLYKKLFGVKIVIRENPALLIGDVGIETMGEKRVLRGTVLNNLKDVPVISLQSISVKAEVRMEDGHIVARTSFPVGPLSEPGALLLGDIGIFEIDLPGTNVKEVSIGAELIDLGGKKEFYLPEPGSRLR